MKKKNYLTDSVLFKNEHATVKEPQQIEADLVEMAIEQFAWILYQQILFEKKDRKDKH
jgi:hypothetical protein